MARNVRAQTYQLSEAGQAAAYLGFTWLTRPLAPAHPVWASLKRQAHPHPPGLVEAGEPR